MRTTKPISTISFNTASYLQVKLKELQKNKIVSFWAFIEHKPEDDEGGKKEHIHLYIEPSKMLQTDDLKAEFMELDLSSGNEKPLGCISFHSSKFDHWYMYSIHDKKYLVSKGQSRRYHYSFDDIVSSDEDELLYRVKSIDLLSLSPYSAMIDAIEQNISWQEFFARGQIPIQQINQYQSAWFLLTSGNTYRNGREGHDNIYSDNSRSFAELGESAEPED